MNFGQWRNLCLAHRLNTRSWSKLDPASWNDQKLPKQSLDDASNISIKRPNIAWNDKMRYKKDTKAKHVVSYTATRNLVKFLALTNLPVQCQCLLKLLLLLLLLLLPCSAAETTGFELSSLTNSQESWIFQNGNFYSSENILFSILLQLGTFLASCRPVVLCSPVLFWRASVAPNHESYLYYSTTSQYSVIHHMFFVQSCTRPIYLSSLSQSKFPITSCVYHSGPQWLQAFPALKKMLEVPRPPLCTLIHIFLSINEMTSGIHITGLSQKEFLWPQLYFTSSLYIDPPSVVIFHDIH